MNGALAIFVKTPGLSPVKSRLAAGRGERYALDWYGKAAVAVASVARLAQAKHGLTTYWAVAESGGLDAWSGLPVIGQGGGDLGTRMARVHAQLVALHGFGLLVGADAPQLTVPLLSEAIDWVGAPQQRLVLGPANDGGFWLFGANTVPSLQAWTAVSYSSADTARNLRRSMQGAGDWRTLAMLTDVDHVIDLPVVEQALHALSDPTPEQRELARWMREQEAAAL